MTKNEEDDAQRSEDVSGENSGTNDSPETEDRSRPTKESPEEPASRGKQAENPASPDNSESHAPQEPTSAPRSQEETGEPARHSFDESADFPDSEAPNSETPNDAEAESSQRTGEAEVGRPASHWGALTPELVQQEARRGDLALRWLVVLLAFLLGCTLIASPSSLVPIKSGAYMLQNGWLPPATDVFSSTATDHPWRNLSWLFDLTSAGLFAAGGFPLLSLIKGLLTALIFGLLVDISHPKVSSWWGSVCAALAVIVCYPQLRAQPELITLLGLTATLWVLHHWQIAQRSRLIFALPLLFLFWSNLDSRMFIGLAALLLYGIGDGIGGWVGRPSLVDAHQRRQFWLALGGSLIAAMIHPFGWHALVSPWMLYSVEYPALRTYLAANPTSMELQVFPIVSGTYWQSCTAHKVGGFLLVLSTLITFTLNRARLDGGQVLLFAGFVGFALAAGHELAATALVLCVLSTLNAQQWYRHRFRQAYSVERTELLFSRGGRAVTMVAFLGIVVLALNGRFTCPLGRTIGLGLATHLHDRIESLREVLEDPFDDRPFNFQLAQGDLLIWLDRKPFVDSRVRVYHGPGRSNILALHRRIRHALINSPANRNGHEHSDFSDTDSASALWKTVFDRYRITHIVPRLTGSEPHYEAYRRLIASPDWRLSRLGPTAAVFYRTDTDNPELNAYLDEHQFNFLVEAFQSATPRDWKPHADWSRRQSFYENPWPASPSKFSMEMRHAQHYYMHLQMAAQGRFHLPPALATAIAYLTLRQAHRGLVEEPYNFEGYRFLGSAYDLLGDVEMRIARAGGGHYNRTLRFYQALHAYQQALALKPDDPEVHLRLLETYYLQQKWDLALKMMNDYEALLAADKEPDADDRRASDQLRDELIQSVEYVSQRIEEELSRQTANPVALAYFAYRSGCVLHALDLLNAESDSSENAETQLLRAILLMESGRSAEASAIFDTLESSAPQVALLPWRSPAAFTYIGRADYDRAIDLWRADVRDRRRRSMAMLLTGLPLVSPPDRWPLHQIRSAGDALYQLPYETGELLFNSMVCYLEAGRVDEATQIAHEMLDTSPATPLRPLIRFYLFQLTGETIDPEPPEDWIPVTTDLFAEEPLAQEPLED